MIKGKATVEVEDVASWNAIAVPMNRLLAEAEKIHIAWFEEDNYGLRDAYEARLAAYTKLASKAAGTASSYITVLFGEIREELERVGEKVDMLSNLPETPAVRGPWKHHYGRQMRLQELADILADAITSTERIADKTIQPTMEKAQKRLF